MSNNFGKQTLAAILSKSISNTYKIAIFYTKFQFVEDDFKMQLFII